MAIEYETQVIRPAQDGQRESIPSPAVRLGQRLAQLSNDNRTVSAQVIIVDGSWHLILPGIPAENLGRIDTT